MAVDTREAYEILSGAETTGSTATEAVVDEPIGDVIERVNEILGYNIFAKNGLAAGYAEFADEALALAENNLDAAAEVLPEE